MMTTFKSELDQSLGGVTWWGFSPWTSLSGERMLVIGAGDPRHLIRTLASQSAMEAEGVNKLEFYLWEQNAHVYCRQILLMHLLNETHLDKDVRARMYLEILGNTLITEDTGAWIRKTSGKFAGIISSGSSDILESSWDLSHLKEKEKEKMVEVFKMWREGAGSKNITEYWTARQQKLLGERYEQREGVADMDYHMHLVERGGAEVNKKSFIRWRGNGIAFRVVEDNINEDDLQTNVTLLSGEGRSAGYWGDITSGPFMCHQDELKYNWSVQDQNQMMHIEDSSSEIEKLEQIMERLDDSGALKCAKFIPISTSSSVKMEKIFKSKRKIDSIWVGLSVSHYIDQSLSQIISEKGTLTVETPLYLFLVGKELLDSFKHKVIELGANAGFSHIFNKDYDVLKCYSVTMTKNK